MLKNIFKEVFIMLLLCAAIILVLSIVFYEYNPINKVVPSTITYSMPETLSDVKEELNTPLLNNDEQVIRIYTITEDDLKIYKKTNYDAGKANPFTVTNTGVTGTENGENETTSTGNGSSINNSSKTTVNGSSSTGSFFEDGPTK